MVTKFDNVDPARSRNMAAIKGKDTGLEMRVRRFLHAAGYRYRIHRKDLPGKPDLVFPSRAKAIFLHGCFWHAHGCPDGKPPKTRQEFWLPKFARNRERDAAAEKALRKAGWKVLVVWECDVRRREETARKRIVRFLGPPGPVFQTDPVGRG